MESKTIKTIKRLNNSSMGNPAFQFTFTDGAVMKTKPNISDAYSVCMSWQGRTIKIETATTKSGRVQIIGLEE